MTTFYNQYKHWRDVVEDKFSETEINKIQWNESSYSGEVRVLRNGVLVAQWKGSNKDNGVGFIKENDKYRGVFNFDLDI